MKRPNCKNQKPASLKDKKYFQNKKSSHLFYICFKNRIKLSKCKNLEPFINTESNTILFFLKYSLNVSIFSNLKILLELIPKTILGNIKDLEDHHQE